MVSHDLLLPVISQRLLSSLGGGDLLDESRFYEQQPFGHLVDLGYGVVAPRSRTQELHN